MEVLIGATWRIRMNRPCVDHLFHYPQKLPTLQSFGPGVLLAAGTFSKLTPSPIIRPCSQVVCVIR